VRGKLLKQFTYSMGKHKGIHRNLKHRLAALEEIEVEHDRLTFHRKFTAWRTKLPSTPWAPLWSGFDEQEIKLLVGLNDTNDRPLSAAERAAAEWLHAASLRELHDAIARVEAGAISVELAPGGPSIVALGDRADRALAGRMQVWVPDCARRLGRAVPRDTTELRTQLDVMQVEYTAEEEQP
jgi:hypothetical protein